MICYDFATTQAYISSAEVIKVEHPTKGDDTRHWGPPYAKYLDDSGKEGPGESAYFFAVAWPHAPIHHKLLAHQ